MMCVGQRGDQVHAACKGGAHSDPCRLVWTKRNGEYGNALSRASVLFFSQRRDLEWVKNMSVLIIPHSCTVIKLITTYYYFSFLQNTNKVISFTYNLYLFNEWLQKVS
jgi:hypothetical protein